MKKSEVLLKYADEIKAAMVEKYRNVLESEGKIQYKIYIWSDGEIRPLMGPVGDSTYLKAKDWETRKLHYVATVSDPCFDFRSYAQYDLPEDETELEELRKEVIDWAVTEYETNLDVVLAQCVEDAEREEEEYERSYGV